MAMQIFLSNQPASPEWGENALISAQTQTAQPAMQIHQKNDKISPPQAIQKAARKLKSQGIKEVSLQGEGWDLEACWAFYQGFVSVKKNQTATYPTELQEKIQFPSFEAEIQAELDARIGCSTFVRALINTGADLLTPSLLASTAAQFIQQQAEKYGKAGSVRYEILQMEQLQQQGYVGLVTVGKGSENSPAYLALDFNPSQDPNAPVLACLVGKGITFDTGGYSLKPSDSMSTMRTDMGGAALLTGALGLAIARGLNQRVKLYLCCAENMVSHNAFRLGDILHYRNGVSAEVLNTDAEGRLVLADGLIDASKQNAKMIIDAATLTGAAKVAVGNDYHSVLSMDDQLVNALFAAAKAENEPFWRLPFEAFHREQISSGFADIANVGSVPVGAGASTATAFLSYFVENYAENWLHIDCSATFRKSASDLWAAGATGIGIKTLANLLIHA